MAGSVSCGFWNSRLKLAPEANPVGGERIAGIRSDSNRGYLPEFVSRRAVIPSLALAPREAESICDE